MSDRRTRAPKARWACLVCGCVEAPAGASCVMRGEHPVLPTSDPERESSLIIGDPNAGPFFTVDRTKRCDVCKQLYYECRCPQ